MNAHEFEDLAAEMSASPRLIKALRDRHRDDGTGHCSSCTHSPGHGTHNVAMPCAIRMLADRAATLAREFARPPMTATSNGSNN